MQKVTLLGLGIIGSGMASNLLKNGFDLTIYNRTRSKTDPFVEQGAHAADTPRKAVENAELVLSIVGDNAASEAVWLGEDGALAGVKPGTILVESSTLTPTWVRELAQLAAEKNCPFLDSPVAGSREAAANAQLGLLVGGDAETIEKAKPVLEAISRRMVRIGTTGAGATWKLINNMMMAAHLATLSEALTLADAAGLDMEQAAQLILNGASSSFIVQNKLPRMMEQSYTDTDFALKWMLKDVRYATELAESLGIPVKTIEAAKTIFEQAQEKGLGNMDFAAVVEALRE